MSGKKENSDGGIYYVLVLVTQAGSCIISNPICHVYYFSFLVILLIFLF